MVGMGFLNSLQWDDDEHIDGPEKFFKLTTSKGLCYTNIHLYNDKCQIKKYDNVNDIFDEFYKIRYELYVKRKAYQLSNIDNELKILESKMRFIQSVMNDEIVIYKRKKIDIIKDLLTHEYIQVTSGKVVEYKKDETTSAYDYLIKMSLYLFTEDEIEKLEKQINDLRNEYHALEKLTIEEIWISECDKLVNYL